MNYQEQARFLAASRLWSAAVIVLTAIAAYVGVASGDTSLSGRVQLAFALTLVAVTASLFYSPDYLHLTVNPEKASKWMLKIRSRLAIAVAVFGVAFGGDMHAR